MNIHASDFIELCGVKPPENWEHFSVTNMGVFVKELLWNSEDERSSESMLLTPSVREKLEPHRLPAGDPQLPVLAFPCTVPEVEKFLTSYGLSHCLNSRTLLVWSVKKQGECSLDELEKRLTDLGLSDGMKQLTLLEWETNKQMEYRDQHREEFELAWTYRNKIDDAEKNKEGHKFASLLAEDLQKMYADGSTPLPPDYVLGNDSVPLDAKNFMAKVKGFGKVQKKLLHKLHPKKSPTKVHALADEFCDSSGTRAAKATTKEAAQFNIEYQKAESKLIALNAGATGAVRQQWVLKKKALKAKHQAQWLTFERDFQDASENGLSAAAKAPGHGYWYEERALIWAKQRGKYAESNQIPSTANATPWTGLVHKI